MRQSRLPKIRHKAGFARVWVGEWKHLGRSDAPDLHAKYQRAVSEWRNAGCPTVARARPDCIELAALYCEHLAAKQAASSLPRARLALRGFLKGYGRRDACAIGPAIIEEWRKAMVREGLTRRTINERVWVVKDMVRHGVQCEIVPPDRWHLLQAVKGLKRGEFGAKDRPPVRSVPAATVDATLPHLPAVVAAMVQVQRHSACRPGEVCAMTPAALDQRGPVVDGVRVWLYRPARHKTSHHGIERTIALGPAAQAALLPFLRLAEPGLPVFRPAYAKPLGGSPLALVGTGKPNQARDAQRRAARADGFRGRRDPGAGYTREAYARCIARACKRAGIERWFPNQLRHLRLTEVRDSDGLAQAAATGGHTKVTTTQVYTDAAVMLAAKVAAKSG